MQARLDVIIGSHNLLFFQVYHEADTFGFVKYVTSVFPHEEFQDIALTYVEQSTTDE